MQLKNKVFRPESLSPQRRPVDTKLSKEELKKPVTHEVVSVAEQNTHREHDIAVATSTVHIEPGDRPTRDKREARPADRGAQSELRNENSVLFNAVFEQQRKLGEQHAAIDELRRVMADRVGRKVFLTCPQGSSVDGFERIERSSASRRE